MRLGDDIDDHCSSCKRTTDHSIVSMMGEEVLRTRCRTCNSEHKYRANKSRSKEMTAKEAFDHVLAMDQVNLRALRSVCPRQHAHKLDLFLRHAQVAPPDEVPDPYYGAAADFRQVIELAEAGAQGLIARLR